MATEAQTAKLAGHFREAITRTHGELINLRASLLRLSDRLLDDGQAGSAARLNTEAAIISRMIAGLAADLDGE
jgi:hypothetical protein